MAESKRPLPSASLLSMRLLGSLPLGVSARLARSLAWLSSWLPLEVASAYRTTLINTMLCNPRLSYRQASWRARRALCGAAENLADCAHVWTAPPERTLNRISQIYGLDAVRTAHAAGKPLLILTLHHSSWELPSLLLGRELPVTIFYNPHRCDELTRAVTRARQATGSRLVTANGRGIKAGLKAMDRREALVIVADHLPKGRNNPDVPFFRHAVRTSALPHQLIRKYQPAVFLMSCTRRGAAGQVEVRFEPAPAAAHDSSPEVALTAINAAMARIIRREPEQYHWTNKRFSRTATGPRGLYRRDSVKALRRARRENRSLGMQELGRH